MRARQPWNEVIMAPGTVLPGRLVFCCSFSRPFADSFQLQRATIPTGAVHPPCQERKKPPSTLRTRRWMIGGSLPPARADGEALQAPERRVVPRAGASSSLRRVPGHGGARGRPAVLGASRGVEPLRGGRAPAAAAAARDPPAVLVPAAVPRRSWPAGRTRRHFRRAPAPGQDAWFIRVGNLVQERRSKFLCYRYGVLQ